MKLKTHEQSVEYRSSAFEINVFEDLQKVIVQTCSR